MKKSIANAKLRLKHETLKLLKADGLRLAAGGIDLSRKLPCPELTAHDCD